MPAEMKGNLRGKVRGQRTKIYHVHVGDGVEGLRAGSTVLHRKCSLVASREAGGQNRSIQLWRGFADCELLFPSPLHCSFFLKKNCLFWNLGTVCDPQLSHPFLLAWLHRVCQAAHSQDWFLLQIFPKSKKQGGASCQESFLNLLFFHSRAAAYSPHAKC